jgi:hypothetical protein
MTIDDELERRLRSWMAESSPPMAPPRLLDRVTEGTATTWQRPSLLARGAVVGPSSGRPTTLLLLGALLVALVMALGAVVAGGGLIRRDGTPPDASAVAPEPYRGELVATAPLPSPLAWPAIATLKDGRVLIVTNWSAPSVGYLFDPIRGSYAEVDPAASLAISATLTLPDGRVLLVGADQSAAGGETAIALLFDPTSATFAPVGPMITPRTGAQLALLPDGRVLVAGGTTPDDSNTTLASAEIFDPASGSFSATGAMGTSRTMHALVPLLDGRVLVVGGERAVGEGATTLSSAEIFDPATGTFAPSGTMPSISGAMSFLAWTSLAVRLEDGRVLVFGRPEYYGSSPVDVWDPTTRAFTEARRTAHAVVGATLLRDGSVFVAGVAGRDGTWSGIYDPVTEMTRSMPAPAAWAPTMARLVDGRVLLVGGLTDGHLRPERGGQLAPAVDTMEIFE